MSRFQEYKDKLRVVYAMTIRKIVETREYRVNFKGGTEASAYYSDDLEDAFATAISMRLSETAADNEAKERARLYELYGDERLKS